MASSDKYRQWREALTALALVGQVGLVVAAGVVGGVLGGLYLDGLLGNTGAVVVVATLAGIGAGVYGAYRLLAKEMKWNR